MTGVTKTGRPQPLILQWATSCVLVALAACTSMEDFQAMTAEERAQEVCTGSRAYKARTSSLRQLDSAIIEKENLLAQGYRVHRQCRQVVVPARTVDCSNTSGGEREACQRANESARDSLAQECVDVPVRIDSEFEYRQLSEYKSTRDIELAVHEEALAYCLARVRDMPADEAWHRYEEGLD